MEVRPGLRENWPQFIILLIVNAFVGGMVGMERAILPELAQQEFSVVAKSALLSFIVVFGFSKAIANYFAGSLAGRVGRRNLLILGWIIASPVPFLIIYANSWTWIVVSNVFLGLSQGLTWSSTVVMKIDLVGEKNRGLAMGLNEFSGYVAVGLVALFTGYIAARYGIRPYPFYTGILLVILGLISSVFFVKDTHSFVSLEKKTSKAALLKNVFWDTTLRQPNLSSVTQAGLVNNLNDGMIWGLLPVLLASRGYNLKEIGFVASIYPAVWGISQLFTGRLADLHSKKKLLFWGMLMQGVSIVFLTYISDTWQYISVSIVLGIGTAIVYPSFLAAIADETHPDQRAESIGVFRLWRDSGYAFGALLSGLIADHFGIYAAILCIGILTILSALFIAIRMKDNLTISRLRSERH